MASPLNATVTLDVFPMGKGSCLINNENVTGYVDENGPSLSKQVVVSGTNTWVVASQYVTLSANTGQPSPILQIVGGNALNSFTISQGVQQVVLVSGTRQPVNPSLPAATSFSLLVKSQGTTSTAWSPKLSNASAGGYTMATDSSGIFVDVVAADNETPSQSLPVVTIAFPSPLTTPVNLFIASPPNQSFGPQIVFVSTTTSTAPLYTIGACPKSIPPFVLTVVNEYNSAAHNYNSAVVPRPVQLTVTSVATKNTTVYSVPAEQGKQVGVFPGDLVQVAVESYLTDFGCTSTSPVSVVQLNKPDTIPYGGFGVQFVIGDSAVQWPANVKIPSLPTVGGCSFQEAALSPSIGYFLCSSPDNGGQSATIVYSPNTLTAVNQLGAAGTLAVSCPQEPPFETNRFLNQQLTVSPFILTEIPDTYCITFTVSSTRLAVENDNNAKSQVVSFNDSPQCVSPSVLPPVTPASGSLTWDIAYSGNESANGMFLSYKQFGAVTFSTANQQIVATASIANSPQLGFEVETFGSPPQNYSQPSTSFFYNTNGASLLPGLQFSMPLNTSGVTLNSAQFTRTTVSGAQGQYTFLRNPYTDSAYGMMLATFLVPGEAVFLDVLPTSIPISNNSNTNPPLAMTMYSIDSLPKNTFAEWGAILFTKYASNAVPTYQDNITDSAVLCARVQNVVYAVVAPSDGSAAYLVPLSGLDLQTCPGFVYASQDTSYNFPLTLLSQLSVSNVFGWTCWNPSVFGCDVDETANPDDIPLCTLAQSKPLPYPFQQQNRCQPTSSNLIPSGTYFEGADEFLINRCAVVYESPTLCKPVAGTAQQKCSGFGMQSLGQSCDAACNAVQLGVVYSPDYFGPVAPCPKNSVNCNSGLGRCDEIKQTFCASEAGRNLGDCACLNVYDSSFPSAVRGYQSFTDFQNDISETFGISANLALYPECFWDTCDVDQGIITSFSRKNCPKTVTDCVAFLKNVNVSNLSPDDSVAIDIANTCNQATPPSYANSSFCRTISSLANTNVNYTTSSLLNYFFPQPAAGPGPGSSSGFVLDGKMGTFDYICIGVAALVNFIMLVIAGLSLLRFMQARRKAK